MKFPIHLSQASVYRFCAGILIRSFSIIHKKPPSFILATMKAALALFFSAVAYANYEFTAWSEIGCVGSKVASTSGDTFDSYCHDVSGQGWYSIGGSAMSIDGQSIVFCQDSGCSVDCFGVDDTAQCSFLSSPYYEQPIGSWKAVQN